MEHKFNFKTEDEAYDFLANMQMGDIDEYIDVKEGTHTLNANFTGGSFKMTVTIFEMDEFSGDCKDANGSWYPVYRDGGFGYEFSDIELVEPILANHFKGLQQIFGVQA